MLPLMVLWYRVVVDRSEAVNVGRINEGEKSEAQARDMDSQRLEADILRVAFSCRKKKRVLRQIWMLSLPNGAN